MLVTIDDIVACIIVLDDFMRDIFDLVAQVVSFSSRVNQSISPVKYHSLRRIYSYFTMLDMS